MRRQWELRERNQLLIDKSFSFLVHGITVSNGNEKRVGMHGPIETELACDWLREVTVGLRPRPVSLNMRI